MVFSFPLNKYDVLIMSGLNLRCQTLNTAYDSNLMPDDESILKFVAKSLERGKRDGSEVFRHLTTLATSSHNHQEEIFPLSTSGTMLMESPW